MQTKQDPKPLLGPAAVQANIEYARGLQKIHSEKYRAALELETKYLNMLAALKKA